jgi:uncharacterized protein (TIGR02145 family)
MKQGLIYLAIFFSATIITSCKKDDKPARTIESGTVTDVDGNIYKTVKIGDKWWMAENLRVSKFNDGTSLQYVAMTDADSIWAQASVPTYMYINDSLFGYLYNGITVLDAHNIAPAGWHVATDADWKALESAVGMSGSELNETGWRGESTGEILTSLHSKGWPEGGVLFGSDDYGFNALPGGCRLFDGRTNIFNNTAFWWTASSSSNELWYRYIDINNKGLFRQHTYMGYGMSIRCVKD